jgi:hypothetical protein
VFARLRARLTYANVVATLALFLALGTGSAVALDGMNTVFSDDIVDGEVSGADVANESLGTADVRNSSLDGLDLRTESVSSGRVFGLDGGDVDDDGLTAADIDEATFSSVPYASRAGIANNSVLLDGLSRPSFMRSATKWKRFVTVGEKLPVSPSHVPCNGDDDCTATLRCDQDDVLLTGGFNQIDNGTRLMAGFPFNANGYDHKYVLHWHNNGTEDTVELNIICADQ